MNKITAPTWAEINLDNIKFNLDNIKKSLNENTKICGVLKANAYGHGSVPIAKLLEKENVDYIAVARLEEGIELRQNKIMLPILCLGYIPEEALATAIDNDITITIYSVEMAQKLNDIAKHIGKHAKIHIKIDTGMSRIGFIPNSQSINDIKSINDLEFVDIEGIFTHFATADEKSKEFTKLQVQRFKYMVEGLEAIDINIPIKHVSNSAAIIDLQDLNLNMVRCGIILYGHYPSEEVDRDIIQLKPAMTLKTRVAHIKDVDKGTGISYGLKYRSDETEKIATIPIGYADGFSRIQKNPKVMIKGNIFDVIGRICMDQCMVKINKNIDIKIGDEVIIFGEEKLTAEDVAKSLETINYEVLCMVSRRVDRIYMERNAILQSDSYLIK
ncbi:MULTISPECIES: alanine racemase [Romboutsia]|uniref:Alanine racemase n=1 Tax=Romboutsia hominis TaxID=1507512 RepID=A0A2P2BMI8_9FIRM|nr:MULTISPECIES: alanine racemase [Romboutsia]MDB8789936.1 alanine racemase [Romboutsia sp. 1001216sp1]MDB8794329.1 alanine racemase [Romboutsia sp. 1001216sp1]MDB8797280.1 alanine racemase [Romboutsia sp. 1001216sp1]MDB8800156.1 alanine racemase [Romboutsia sp. 1001216sp1]MDB8802990.1 alanine racemase [Romboutsia sp. 1001216sp1]